MDKALIDGIAKLDSANELLREAIESSMRIQDLWLYTDVSPEHRDEAMALCKMNELFVKALEET